MLCENILFLRLLSYFYIIMDISRFAVPIILMIKVTMDTVKKMADEKDEKYKEKVTKRIVAAIVFFLVPTFVNIFLSFMETLTGMKFNYSECKANIKNIDYYIELAEEKKDLEHEQENIKAKENYKIYQANLKNSIQNKTGGDGSYIGKKYNLNDKQITAIAKVCQREQGSPKGAAAEAELMINKYVLSGYKGSLYDYLFNSNARNWWAPIKSGRYHSTNLKPDIKEAVRKVVNEGIRTLPGYINEHDCIGCGDVMYIKTNGKSANKNKREDFVRDKTFVYTVYKRSSKVKYWIFYSFPDVKSDPFGYTVDAKEKLAKISK